MQYMHRAVTLPPQSGLSVRRLLADPIRLARRFNSENRLISYCTRVAVTMFQVKLRLATGGRQEALGREGLIRSTYLV